MVINQCELITIKSTTNKSIKPIRFDRLQLQYISQTKSPNIWRVYSLTVMYLSNYILGCTYVNYVFLYMAVTKLMCNLSFSSPWLLWHLMPRDKRLYCFDKSIVCQ
jgi:hypothetical protein